jgi:hypothetical protein
MGNLNSIKAPDPFVIARVAIPLLEARIVTPLGVLTFLIFARSFAVF